MGIEPTSEAWEASILPLYDARSDGIVPANRLAEKRCSSDQPRTASQSLSRPLPQNSSRSATCMTRLSVSVSPAKPKDAAWSILALIECGSNRTLLVTLTTTFGEVTQTRGPRLVQFALKFR